MTTKKFYCFIFLGLYLWQIPMLIESATTNPNSLLLLLPLSLVTFFMCMNLSILVLVYLTRNKALVIGFPTLMFVLNQIEEIEDEKENTWPAINVEYNSTIWLSGLRRWIQSPIRKGMGSNLIVVLAYFKRQKVGNNFPL